MRCALLRQRARLPEKNEARPARGCTCRARRIGQPRVRAIARTAVEVAVPPEPIRTDGPGTPARTARAGTARLPGTRAAPAARTRQPVAAPPPADRRPRGARPQREEAETAEARRRQRTSPDGRPRTRPAPARRRWDRRREPPARQCR